jgi:hypothetical protein
MVYLISYTDSSQPLGMGLLNSDQVAKMSKSAKPSHADQPKKRKGVLRGWFSKLIEDQMRMASSPRRDRLIAETKEAINRVRALRVAPTRVEQFEDAVRRQRLSQQHLDEQARRYKNVHLGLYALAGALLVWAFYLTLKFNWFYGVGALLAATSAAINGYIHGFRAWQIEHRSLIKLQDALRIPSTYLVL